MNYGKNEVEKTLCKTNSRAQKITSHLDVYKRQFHTWSMVAHSHWFVKSHRGRGKISTKAARNAVSRPNLLTDTVPA